MRDFKLSNFRPNRSTRTVVLFAAAGLALAACATPPPAAGGGSRLVGGEWRLEDLLGGGLIDRSNVTLSLAEGGQAAGSGGCNRYFGSWTSKGQALSLGKMGATMMACAPALMAQEGRYLKALETAKSYSFTDDGALLIATDQGPLTFRRD